jgi:hypothetical protein
MTGEHPNPGDVVIWNVEPEGATPTFWVRTQSRGSATPIFEGIDAWQRALAAAVELAGTDRTIWLRDKDGHFKRLESST